MPQNIGTLHLFAQHSTTYCAWARAFCDLCQERVDTYTTALRKLADKWHKIINRMVETRQPDDDQGYIEALPRRGSPVYQRLVENLVENPPAAPLLELSGNWEGNANAWPDGLYGSVSGASYHMMNW